MITSFTLDPAALGRIGRGLRRAENVLGFRDGTIFAGSDRPFITRIAPGGDQTTVGRIPNGELSTMALENEEALLVTSTYDGKVYRLWLNGTSEVYFDEMNGRPHGRANFVFVDTKKRTWIVVATRNHTYPPDPVVVADDGYVVLVDERGARIVIDGLRWPNEIRFDADERHAFIPESFGRRILRFTVAEDGQLEDGTPFGPDPLDEMVIPDGIAVDQEGNVWCASISTNGLIIVTADGERHIVFEDRNEAALAAWLPRFERGMFTRDMVRSWAGPTLKLPTSVAFAGPDLRTVVMGSLMMPELLTFESPVSGLPLWHQSLTRAPEFPQS